MTDHKNLSEALVAFQAECPTLPKDATNPHFKSKFTPLDTMVEVVTPLLSKHGLSWSTFPCFAEDGSPALRYVLRHVSGDKESEVMPLLVTKVDPQGMGSAITYARRYSLAAVLNLVADDDDDGNSASTPRQQSQRRPAREHPPTATPDDIEALSSACKGLTAKQIKLVFSSVGLTAPDPFPANPGLAFAGVPQAKTADLYQALGSVERAVAA